MAHNKIDNRQVDMFQSTERYRIDKPIRLIELFAGYGSQALALKYLGVPFEHWCISEWAIKSIRDESIFANGRISYRSLWGRRLSGHQNRRG